MTPLRSVICIALLALAIPLQANTDTPATSAPLFAANDILDVTIEVPLDRLMLERPTEEELPATLLYEDADGSTVSLEIGVRTRGKYRRQWRICPFAPLRLNFRKAEVKDTLFATVDKIKMVTHCRSGRDSYQQTVLREFLAYRILNIITDYSYRVRLLRVRYVDTENDDVNADNFGFLIEHRDQLAERTGLEVKKLDATHVADLDPTHTNLGSLFQYLIGNTDFSPIAGTAGEECCHNYSLLGQTDGPLFAVPYDFDMSGWVNAAYATPNPKFDLRNVRERLYRGRCENNSLLATSVQLFQDHQAEISALVTESEHLKTSTKNQLIRYLDDFYKRTGNPKTVQSRLLKKCAE
jgi:hypothetical protein